MIKATFKESDVKRLLFAAEKVASAVVIEKKEFVKKSASQFRLLLIENINSDKYGGTYVPYSERYAKWKSDLKTVSAGFWKLKGDLVRNITSWETLDTYITTKYKVGIPAGILDSGDKSYGDGSSKAKKGTGKKSVEGGHQSYIAAYARVMEYGGKFAGQTHPARPLFTPTTLAYRSSQDFLSNKVLALKRLGRHWS